MKCPFCSIKIQHFEEHIKNCYHEHCLVKFSKNKVNGRKKGYNEKKSQSKEESTFEKKNNSWDKKIKQNIELGLTPKRDSVVQAIGNLTELMSNNRISRIQKNNIVIALARLKQKMGEHHEAIEQINRLKLDENSEVYEFFIFNRSVIIAISFSELGYNNLACEIFDDILEFLKVSEMKGLIETKVFIIAGKAYYQSGNRIKADICWKKALKLLYGTNKKSIDCLNTLSNIAYSKLNDPNDEEQKNGLKIIENLIKKKIECGDFIGLAITYCNLGIYYWRSKKNYKRAISYFWEDLSLTRKIGNKKDLATTLNNFAGLYHDLKQISSARKFLNEAMDISKSLSDTNSIEKTKNNLEMLNHHAKINNLKGIKFGPKSLCKCGSNKHYKDCCGLVDYEPVDLPWNFLGVSKEAVKVIQEVEEKGGNYTGLNFILRESEESKSRLAWTKIEYNEGLLSKILELPDMANLHLYSAKNLAIESKSEDRLIDKPMSVIILSVCALEAFINQVSFFANQYNLPDKKEILRLFPDFKEDVNEFQRYTSLVQKWKILGKVLCGDNWPSKLELWRNFKSLVKIRNNLVHFISDEYEVTIPKPKNPQSIIKLLPKSVKIQDIPRSWPFCILNSSVAEWSVKVAEEMIHSFKQGYYDKSTTSD